MAHYRYPFIYKHVALKSHMEWSNVQRDSEPTSTVLPTIESTYNCLNCFSHLIYTSSTSTYQNIAKLFLHLSMMIDCRMCFSWCNYTDVESHCSSVWSSVSKSTDAICSWQGLWLQVSVLSKTKSSTRFNMSFTHLEFRVQRKRISMTSSCVSDGCEAMRSFARNRILRLFWWM